MTKYHLTTAIINKFLVVVIIFLQFKLVVAQLLLPTNYHSQNYSFNPALSVADTFKIKFDLSCINDRFKNYTHNGMVFQVMSQLPDHKINIGIQGNVVNSKFKVMPDDYKVSQISLNISKKIFSGKKLLVSAGLALGNYRSLLTNSTLLQVNKSSEFYISGFAVAKYNFIEIGYSGVVPFSEFLNISVPFPINNNNFAVNNLFIGLDFAIDKHHFKPQIFYTSNFEIESQWGLNYSCKNFYFGIFKSRYFAGSYEDSHKINFLIGNTFKKKYYIFYSFISRIQNASYKNLSHQMGLNLTL